MTIPKTPGWGLILKTRTGENGKPEALLQLPDRNAPYWCDLAEAARHRAQTIEPKHDNP